MDSRTLLVVLALVVGVQTTAAAAAPVEVAFQRYKRGLRAYKKGNYRVAIKLFEASIAQQEHRNTLYYLGESYRRLGQLRRAYAYYRRYADKLPVRRRRVFDDKLAKLRVEAPCRVSLAVRPANAVIVVDGGVAQRLPRGGGPLLLDLAGGRHTIEVRAGGYITQRRTIDALFGEPRATSVILDPLRQPRRPLPAALAPVKHIKARPPTTRDKSSGTLARRNRTSGRSTLRDEAGGPFPRRDGAHDARGRGWLVAGLVLAGTSAAALATAIAFNVKHKNEYEGELANRDKGIAIGAYVAAAVLGAGTITCLVVHALGLRRPPRVAVVPWLLRGGAALGARVAF